MAAIRSVSAHHFCSALQAYNFQYKTEGFLEMLDSVNLVFLVTHSCCHSVSWVT